ncbi:hypothetical protein GIB67_022822 [Kingdonia uniflora]|uniref:Pectin acetylesterase n=1 Tax=Kingdonia uniflora TaxID=39325 RepID=A0A7J7P6T4_9MAGN|nr:hypothetical protein GIB67_022822 [Kingdonia uniflora]
MRLASFLFFVGFAVLLMCVQWRSVVCAMGDDTLRVGMTLVRDAAFQGAVCLDGSLPAYHLHMGFGSGANNWLLQFEGGGWCNTLDSCYHRSLERRGSTKYMARYEPFIGILSNKASQNPDFYNWNRVKIRYCDGASFAGDTMFQNDTVKLYFRGQRIWHAIILDLLPKGLGRAEKALLSGCSAGGLATFFHCDNFTSMLPKTATVKCMSDAGFFLDVRDVGLSHTARAFYESLVDLQGVEQSLDRNCTSARYYPKQCFFPQYALPYIRTPYFILNTAYDAYQFHHHFVPPSTDLQGHWRQCKLNASLCNPVQIDILQGYRYEMLKAVAFFYEYSKQGGMFINSCFAHCQSEIQDTWFASDSPRVHNKKIAEAVGDWYFDRNVAKEIDCAYPCDTTCHNRLI